MATRNIVPRVDGEGGIGKSTKKWGNGFFHDLETGGLNLNDATELTIATGAITVTQSLHIIDTESDGATDDLDTINGGSEGDLLFVRGADNARVVTIKSGTGNIITSDGSDFELSNVNTIALLVYNGTNWNLISGGGGSGGGSTELEFHGGDFSFDSTDIGADRGSVWGILESVDYDPSTEGSAWISFKLPSHWSAASDINVDLFYNLNGSDDSKNIDLEFDAWCVSVGDTPNIASPDDTVQYTLSSGTTQNNALRSLAQATSSFKISSANISDGDIISIRVRRDANDGVNDTYTGTYQMIKLRAYQS